MAQQGNHRHGGDDDYDDYGEVDGPQLSLGPAGISSIAGVAAAAAKAAGWGVPSGTATADSGTGAASAPAAPVPMAIHIPIGRDTSPLPSSRVSLLQELRQQQQQQQQQQRRISPAAKLPELREGVPNFLALFSAALPEKRRRRKRRWRGGDRANVAARVETEPDEANEWDRSEHVGSAAQLQGGTAAAADAELMQRNPYTAALADWRASKGARHAARSGSGDESSTSTGSPASSAFDTESDESGDERGGAGLQARRDAGPNLRTDDAMQCDVAAVAESASTGPVATAAAVASTNASVSLSDTLFHPLQQTAWEDGIAWSSGDESPVAVAAARPARARFALLSDELDAGTWSDAVVWDEHTPCRPAPLILDRNDPHCPQPQPMPPPPPPVLYDLSQDAYYQAGRRVKLRQRLGRAPLAHVHGWRRLVHAVWPLIDLRRFHRPVLLPLDEWRRPVEVLPADAPAPTAISSVRDLSATGGHLVLVEYMEERPPLIMNAGMATRMRHYHRRLNAADTLTAQQEQALDGDLVELEAGEQAPFLGDVMPGQLVSALTNNLFNAVIMPHTPRRTDFLVVRRNHALFIRPLPTVYAAGQQEPLIEVPAPSSRVANTASRWRLHLIAPVVLRQLSGYRLSSVVGHLIDAFPDMPEDLILRRIQELYSLDEDGIIPHDLTRPLSKEVHDQLTPEMLCVYESMLAGRQRLLDVGLTTLMELSGVDQAVKQLEEAPVPDSVRAAAMLIEEELRLAPWTLTSNFVAAANGRALLTLSGLGDPSGCGDAFSYQIIPLNRQPRKGDKKPDVEVKIVTGTDADLRKLTLVEANKLLMDFGMPLDTIQKLTRWQRIDLVRTLSTKASQQSENVSVAKFARGFRQPVMQAAEYRDKSNKIFQRMLTWLRAEPDDSDSDSDEEDDDLLNLQSFERALESRLRPHGGTDLAPQEEREEAAKLGQLVHETSAADPDEVGVHRLQLMINPSWEPGDDDTAQSGRQGGWIADDGRRKFIKRMAVVQLPDGSTTTRVDIIRDPVVIAAFVRHKDRLGLKGSVPQEDKNKRRKGPPLPGEPATITIPAGGAKPPTCRACGGFGHSRTSRSCPKNPAVIAARERMEAEARERAEREAQLAREREAAEQEAAARAEEEAAALAEGDQAAAAAAAGSADAAVPAPAPAGETPADGAPPVKLILRIPRKEKATPAAAAVEPPATSLAPTAAVTASESASDAARRRRGRGGTGPGGLSQVLVQAIDRLKTLYPTAYRMFSTRPGRELPDYHQIVTEYMDLKMIRARANKMEYRTRYDAVRDFRLMVDNCYRYNAASTPELLPVMDELFAEFLRELEQNDAYLRECEVAAGATPQELDAQANEMAKANARWLPAAGRSFLADSGTYVDVGDAADVYSTAPVVAEPTPQPAPMDVSASRATPASDGRAAGEMSERDGASEDIDITE